MTITEIRNWNKGIRARNVITDSGKFAKKKKRGILLGIDDNNISYVTVTWKKRLAMVGLEGAAKFWG